MGRDRAPIVFANSHSQIPNPRALSHVSTHKYFYVFVHVASFRLGHVSHLSSLFERPSRYPGASCSDYLRCRPALTSLIASNLF
uniref:Uncharacterized protein n=1 Tax=Vitis vinifera TaxID=29760 RepID=F6GVF2_VITVI